MLKLICFLDGRLQSSLSFVQLEILKSCLMRDDYKKAKQMLSDWGVGKRAHISKWVPGDHYHVLSRKFDTYTEAKTYAESEGYVCDSSVRYRRIDNARSHNR